MASLKASLKRLRGDAATRSEVGQVLRAIEDLRHDLGTSSAQASESVQSSSPWQPDPSSHQVASSSSYVREVFCSYTDSTRAWLADERPWYTNGATTWLERYISPTDSVFEYGGGKSTVWWCKLAEQVTTLEASPFWAAYLNLYLGSRPELMAKFVTIHVPSDWNPGAPDGLKRYWKARRSTLTQGRIDQLERRYLNVDPGPVDVVAFDGSIRGLTMGRWALDGRGARGAQIIVVDNTEIAPISSLGALIGDGMVRLDFPARPGDAIPSHQKGKHVTSVWVSESRMEGCDRGDALSQDEELAAHQQAPDLDSVSLGRYLDELRARLAVLGIATVG